MSAKVMSWDWRSHPDLETLDKLVSSVSSGAVRARAVPDTGCDSYALVISDEELSDEAAQAVWETFCGNEWSNETIND